MNRKKKQPRPKPGKARATMAEGKGGKPFPHRGWWRGLTTKEFREQMHEFFNTEYYLHEIKWTYDLLQNGVVIGEVGVLENMADDRSPWLVEWEAEHGAAGLGRPSSLAFVHRTDLECPDGPYLFYQELLLGVRTNLGYLYQVRRKR